MENIQVFETGSVIAQVSDESGGTETFIIVAQVDVDDRTICVGYRGDILSGPAELLERYEADDGETWLQPLEDEELSAGIEQKLWELESAESGHDNIDDER